MSKYSPVFPENYQGTHPPSRAERLFYGIILIVSVLGWIVFFLMWWEVLLDPIILELEVALWQLGVLIVMTIVASLLWVRHNRYRGRDSRRKAVPESLPVSLERDYLGRRLIIEDINAVRTMPHVIVDADAETKTYSIGDDGRISVAD